MKTELFDFVLSTLVIALISVISLLCSAFESEWVSRPNFGAYFIFADVLSFLFIYGLISALFCRLLVARSLIRPGTYAMGDPLFRWWKLFTVIYEFGRGALLPFTTVFAKPVVAKLFGAKIGSDIALGGHLVDPQFVTIGDEAIIGQGSVITSHTITSGYLTLDPVVIGARATIGVHAVVMSGVHVGDGAVVTAGAVVPPKTLIPAGEMWGGVPAKKIKDSVVS